ncbi:MAG: hypothetical protein AAGH64_10120, partial [Planctomycetota bacterium]
MQAPQIAIAGLLAVAGLGAVVAVTGAGGGGNGASENRGVRTAPGQSRADARFGRGSVGSGRIANNRSFFTTPEPSGRRLPAGVSPSEFGSPMRAGRSAPTSAAAPRLNTLEPEEFDEPAPTAPVEASDEEDATPIERIDVGAMQRTRDQAADDA